MRGPSAGVEPGWTGGSPTKRTAQRYLPRRSGPGGRLAEEDRCYVEEAGTDGLELADGLAERHELDDIALEGNHLAEGALETDRVPSFAAAPSATTTIDA